MTQIPEGYARDLDTARAAVEVWCKANPQRTLVFDYDDRVALIGGLATVAPFVCQCDDARELCAFVVKHAPRTTWMMFRYVLETTLVQTPSEADA
jgi:hypothetical protein